MRAFVYGLCVGCVCVGMCESALACVRGLRRRRRRVAGSVGGEAKFFKKTNK